MGRIPAQTLRVAKAAARRAALGELVHVGGWALSIGGGTAVGLVGADKLAGGLAPWPWLVGVPIAAAALGAVGIAVARRWSAARAARELDRRLELKDALATGLALAQRDDAFAAWAVGEAERAAAGVSLARAVPVRAGWVWSVWPALVAGAVALAMFVPAMKWQPTSRPVASRQESAEAARQLGQVASAVKEGLGDSAVREASRDQLALLDEVQKELQTGQVSPKEGGARAASAIEEIARRMDAAAATQERSADRVREELSRAAREAGPSEGTGIAEALKRGDLEAASRAAAEAERSRERMTGEQRERLAQELDSLSRALAEEPKAAGAKRGNQGAKEGGKRPVAGAEGAMGAGNQSKPEQPQSTRGAETASGGRGSPDAANQQEEQKQEREAQEQAERDKRELQRTMRDAARELRGEPPESPKDPEHSGPKPQNGEPHEPRPKNGERGAGEQPSNEQSPQGQTGSSGESGASGKSGSAGEEGATGAESRTGAGAQTGRRREGQTGESGSTGQPGSTGPQGASGATQRPRESSRQGKSGQRGASGGTGASGVQGITGSSDGTGSDERSGQEPRSGSQGARQSTAGGQEGQSGASGETGNSGETGTWGATGSSGQTGASGQSGSSAAPGATGATGSGQPETTGKQDQPPPERPQGDKRQSPGSPTSSPAMKRLVEQLQRIAQGHELPSRQEAERLRQMADKAMKEMTPEQREQMQKLAQEFAKSGGAHPPSSEGGHAGSEPGAGPGEHAAGVPRQPWRGESLPVDARRPAAAGQKPQERTLAEWSGPGQKEPGAPESGGVSQAMREAAQGAERAVEQQQVPARYSDLVRRVFKRYAQGAARGQPENPK